MHEAVMGSQGVMLDTVALQRSRPRALRYRSRSQWYDESCDTKRSHQDYRSSSQTLDSRIPKRLTAAVDKKGGIAIATGILAK